MKKLLGLIIFVGLVVFLYKTCPTKEAHAEALADVVPELINAKLSEIGIENALGENAQVSEAMQQVAQAMIDVDNYFIFSIGKENFTASDHVVSFGIGGYVFTVNDEIFQKTSDAFETAKEFTEDVAEKIMESIN